MVRGAAAARPHPVRPRAVVRGRGLPPVAPVPVGRVAVYFTFLIRAADDTAAEAQYLAAWDQAVRACAAAGGTLTHHHGVGQLKSPFLATELGPAGVQVLRKIKDALDPAAIMNRRVLLPPTPVPPPPSPLPPRATLP